MQAFSRGATAPTGGATTPIVLSAIYETVHAIKPWVKVASVPFGIRRPDQRPAGIAGFSQYDKYADVEHWLGWWLTIGTAALYWPIDREARAFAVLLTYWSERELARAASWPGLFTGSRIDDSEKSGNPERSASKSRCSAGLRRGEPGHVHFSAAALVPEPEGHRRRAGEDDLCRCRSVPSTPLVRPAGSGGSAPRSRPLVRQ